MSAQTPVIDSWSCPTTVFAGAGALRRWFAQPEADGCVLVVDAEVWRVQQERLGEATADRVATRLVVAAGDNDAQRVVAISAELARRPDATVVAVGGGSVLDAARLAVLARGDDRVHLMLEHGSGMAMFPADRTASAALVCVPTTFGTAAEVSPIAMFRDGERKVMVVSPALRAHVAVIDPELTRSLPPQLCAAGLLEPWSRAVVPAVCGEPLLPADAIARALADTIKALGRESAGAMRADHNSAGVHNADASGGDRSANGTAWRLAAALTSAQTHTAFLSLGRSPFGHALWPFATEISAAWGVSKAVALTWLIPAWLEGLAAGELGASFGTSLRVQHVLGSPPVDAAEEFRRWCAGLGLAFTAPPVAEGGAATGAGRVTAPPSPPTLPPASQPLPTLPHPTPATVTAGVRSIWQAGGYFLTGVSAGEVDWLVSRAWPTENSNSVL